MLGVALREDGRRLPEIGEVDGTGREGFKHRQTSREFRPLHRLAGVQQGFIEQVLGLQHQQRWMTIGPLAGIVLAKVFPLPSDLMACPDTGTPSARVIGVAAITPAAPWARCAWPQGKSPVQQIA
jgi:hypothetical protein